MSMRASHAAMADAHAKNAAGQALGKRHPLASLAYSRWKTMPRDDVMDEMAILFHLAVQLDDVIAIEKGLEK